MVEKVEEGEEEEEWEEMSILAVERHALPRTGSSPAQAGSGQGQGQHISDPTYWVNTDIVHPESTCTDMG